jgi:hypothetical protein
LNDPGQLKAAHGISMPYNFFHPSAEKHILKNIGFIFFSKDPFGSKRMKAFG